MTGNCTQHFWQFIHGLCVLGIFASQKFGNLAGSHKLAPPLLADQLINAEQLFSATAFVGNGNA